MGIDRIFLVERKLLYEVSKGRPSVPLYSHARVRLGALPAINGHALAG
jgi:hypothetical protein